VNTLHEQLQQQCSHTGLTGVMCELLKWFRSIKRTIQTNTDTEHILHPHDYTIYKAI